MSLRETSSVRRSVRAALQPHARVVLAVSGGIDSMVLLDAAAAELPADRLVVANFDHGTGHAAAAAQDLVRRSAGARRLHFVADRATRTLTNEAMFRDARWAFLRRVAMHENATVVTAHTSDDQVETVLMRLLRDAGARGLAGLYATSDLVRPLLEHTRRSLVGYGRARGVDWVEDPSNASRAYLRNRVRHDLLPALRSVRSGIGDDLLALSRDAARLRQDIEAFVARDVRVGRTRHGLDIDAVALRDRTVEELSVLWPAIVATAGVTLDRRGTLRLAEFTNGGRVGGRIQLSGGWTVTRSRAAFQLRAGVGSAPAHERLELSNTTAWGDWSFRPAGDGRPDDRWSAWLPTDTPLSVRGWLAGDSMSCRNGSPRKVKYYLSDAGVTGHERRGWPVVLAGTEIVWIPGVRRSDAATVRSGRPGLPFICEYSNR